jgi:DNA-binding transcriptional LysR family regulator
MSLASTRLPDTRKLRHVVAVAKAGSFKGATQLLAITQSALTKSIAELEDQLGYPIFERLPRGVRLTHAGQLFVQGAERLIGELTDLMKEVDEISDLQSGRLKLGVAPTAFVTFLDKSIPAFASQYPGIEIEVKTGTIDEMARALINRELDLCVGAANYLRPWKELGTVSLGEMQTFFIGRKNHPAGARADAGTLLEYPVILPATGLSTEVNLASAYLAAGLSPRQPHYVCDHFPVVMDIVASTDAISPVVSMGPPHARLRSNFTIYEDVIELETHELGISTQSSATPSPPATAFIELLKSMLPRQEQSFA